MINASTRRRIVRNLKNLAVAMRHDNWNFWRNDIKNVLLAARLLNIPLGKKGRK